MKRIVFLAAILCAVVSEAFSQNVFNPADGIVRYDSTKVLGSAQRPDPAKAGLQKWVSTPSTGISVGSTTFDVSSFKQYFINVNGNKLAFRVKFPYSYSRPEGVNKKYPVALFLHGASTVGCSANGGIYNNEMQLWIGGKRFRDHVDNNRFDGFLLYPQLVVPAGVCSGAWGTAAAGNFTAILAMVDSMSKYIRADIDRLLVYGLSGGGYGAWRMIATYPQRVASIIPSSAAGSTDTRDGFVHIPIWFATGGKDTDPSPAAAQYAYTRMKDIGANVRYTSYPDLGHGVWEQHWSEPGFIDRMNEAHKATPLIFFQHSDFCPGEPINARLGITPGFYAYEWQKDGVTIATRTNGVNTIVGPASVISFTGNEINVKAFGTYQVHFKRTAGSAWSAWSPKPAVIKQKATTQTPPITISGLKSKVLPAPDGSNTVPLQLPAGFSSYEWYRVSDNVKVASTQIYNAPAGVYKARYLEQFGCGSVLSPNFTVVSASGTPKPDAATTLTTVPVSQSSIRLNWTQVASPASNETGFEVYRATVAGGPYVFAGITAPNIVTFQDTGLKANTSYYYTVRPVNETGAAVATNESPAKTLSDNSVPTAPANLQYRGSTITSVTLKWTASTDNDGIKRYDVYANGAKLYSTTATLFTATNLDSLTSYNFVVKAIDNAGNISASSNQVAGYTHRQGLNYKYYNGTWTVLPDYNILSPAKLGVTDTVSINSGIKTQVTKYGFLWQAYIYIPVTATYVFETGSDDGSKLYLDMAYANNATALVSNDGIHGVQLKTGSKQLTQGYHQIAITHFQNAYGEDMQVFWSNNAGLVREMIPKNFFSVANVALGGAPALPTGLIATATAYNKIRLNWADNSNNETGFEIVRSLASNGTFTPIGTTAANAVTYTDSGLTASKIYYYKIRAIGNGIESAFTAQASATTPAAPATPVAPSQLIGQAGANNSISMNWLDNSTNETGFQIYRSTDNVTFGLIGSVPANNNAYTDNTAVALKVYYYNVAGVNAAGTGAKSNTIQITAGNNAPVIGQLDNLFVKSDASVQKDFTVSDDPGDVVTVKIINKPSFIALTGLGSGNYRVTATPGVDNIGWFDITVVATDNSGKSSSKLINIAVADKNTRSVYINFGSATKAAPLPWNNWLGLRGANNVLANLKDETNTVTPFSITSVTGWWTVNDLGHITGNNSGVLPDAVLESGIADNGAPKVMKVRGLNLTKKYNLAFVGSMNEGPLATTEYAIGTQKTVMDARYNTTQTANLNSLTPDVNGELLVTITRTGTTFATYLNAIVIEEYDPSITLLNPRNLYVEPLDRTSTKLTWSDRTNNEGGYELVRATDSLFTLNVATISLSGNVTTYTNTGLAPNTKYWYRVRAKNGSNYSGYSNRARTITPASLVYVNFNTTLPNAAAPWNNLATPSEALFSVTNLRNQSGAVTPIGISLQKPFNGEFTAGVNTGNNSGVVPDNVLMDNYWLDNTQLSQFKVTGLNYSKRYRFGFFGSSSSNGWFKGNYTATYTINGRTVYLNAWQNSTKIVYIGDVVPDDNGEVLLNFSTTQAALYGFNGGFIISEYTDTQGGGVANAAILSDEPITDLDSMITDIKSTQVRVYPNPFSDLINLDFYNSRADNKISTEIYDLSGRLAYRHNYNNIAAGANTLKLNTLETKMGTGIFLVALKVNGKIVQTVKMIRLKQY